MKMSAEVNDLFSAMAKFQGQLDNATKGKAGHGYKYADLAAVINAAKEPLSANGLSVTQLLGTNAAGNHSLITMLAHSSGQYMSSETELPKAVLQGGAGKNPVQVIGSAITYFRRYSYAAIIGMAQEDDDGQSVQQPAQTTEPEKPWLNLPDDNLKKWVCEQVAAGSAHEQLIKTLQVTYKISKSNIEIIKAMK